jgi:hypothetical protein
MKSPMDESVMWFTCSVARPQFLTICWDATAEDGTAITLKATLCKAHRQVIALESTSARGLRRRLGESCDLCDGRTPQPLN